MTRSRYRIFATDYPYFMTCTVVGWLPVFTRPEAVAIVFDSWKHLQQHDDFKLFGYVILENHLHLIASAPELPTVMQRFKAFTARRLLDLLQESGADQLLLQLGAHKLRHKAESKYQLWQEGNHPQQVRTEEILWQKLRCKI